MDNRILNQQNNSGPDIKAILYRFLSKWYLFVISLALAFGIAKVYLRYQDNIYSVSTTLHFKAINNSYKTLGGLELFDNTQNISDEIQVIKSFDFMSKVMKELDFNVSYYHKGDIRTVEFYKDSPIRVELDSSSFQLAGVPFIITILNGNEYRLQAGFETAKVVDTKRKTVEGTAKGQIINEIMKFGQNFKSENISFKVFLTNPYYKQPEGQLFFVINNPDLLANTYKNRINIAPIHKESSILRLSVSGPVVEKDIDFLNTLSEVYIHEGLDEKNRIATNTINFIDEQLGKISDSLRSTEKEIENFRTKYNYKETEQGLEKAIDKLDQLETEKADMIMKMEYYQYVLDYIKNNKDLKQIVAPSSIGLEDEILGNLINELITLKTERAVLIGTTSEKNPYIKELDKKIKTTTETLYENVHNILKVSNIPVKNINNRIAEIERSLNGLPEKDRLWLDIQRKFNLNNHLYNFLLEKRAEAGITRASTKPDHEVVEKASWLNAHQIAPNASTVFNVAILIGLLVPLALIAGLDYLNDKVKSKEDITKRTSVPVLGVIGHKSLDSNLVVAEKPKSGIAEAFRSVRMNLSYISSRKKNNLIVVTSSISGEGKTFFSINLANVIAISDKKTILVGADLRKPKIFDDFGIENVRGLSSYLAGKCELDEVINKTHISNFDLITSGLIPPNPSELLGSERMQSLFDELKERYDYIIVDTPPVGLVSDGFDLMRYADINIYLVRHNYTRYKMLDRADMIYKEGKVKNMGIVINDLKATDAKYYGYGNTYGYGYYYSYGYYEQDKPERKINKIMKRLKLS